MAAPMPICGRCRQALRKSLMTYLNSLRRHSAWRGVVGLEIHAQISSKSKLFSGAATTYGAYANSQVSFFDAALPGTLPVLNRRCVEAAVAAAVALQCQLSTVSTFDRKHYFYADMPAGYQITQHRSPVARRGQLEYVDFVFGRDKTAKLKTACITQIQIEQDSGKSMYDAAAQQSLLDLNRAGIGLMEIVTEPDFSSGKEAAAFVRELHGLLKDIGCCDGKMEEGALRVDANISVHRAGEPLGIRVEVKNLNSFKHVASAIDYEIGRQVEVLASGGTIVNETRSFDNEKRVTISMRDKEKLQDYRIMPEPNLLPLYLHQSLPDQPAGKRADCQVDVEQVAALLPELPSSIRRRLLSDYSLTLEYAVLLMSYEGFLQLFHDVCRRAPAANPTRTCSFMLKNVLAFLNDNGLSVANSTISITQLASLCEGIGHDLLTETTAKKVMELWHAGTEEERSASLSTILAQRKWHKITNPDEIRLIAAQVLSKNSKLAMQYKQKKHKAIFNKLMEKFMEQSQLRVDFFTALDVMEGEIDKM